MALIRQNPFKKSGLTIFIVLLSTFVTQLHGTPINSQNGTAELPTKPQGKQGILEIPKQAATIIRNFIDSNLQAYLNLSTPAPNPQAPPELSNSIIGSFLLGNWYVTPAPAPPYDPAKPPNIVTPIFTSNEPTFMEHSVHLTTPSTIPPTTPPPTSAPEQLLSGETSKPRIRTRRTTKIPVHILDTENSLNGIYNSYGVLVNNNNNNNNSPDEVYWIPDLDNTRPSVVIPIETSTIRNVQYAYDKQTTVKTTTEVNDGDEEEETSNEI